MIAKTESQRGKKNDNQIVGISLITQFHFTLMSGGNEREKLFKKGFCVIQTEKIQLKLFMEMIIIAIFLLSLPHALEYMIFS